MAPSLIVMVREAVVVSATHGGLLYQLIHCSIAQLTVGEYFESENQ